jgi:bifunctional DNA-binding transcriptional regulator/antitoxin component of YhaV-PrlF toxin-antitoxin module
MKEIYYETVEENKEGDLILPIPVELLSQMGWDESTILEWVIMEDKVYLKEADDSSKPE